MWGSPMDEKSMKIQLIRINNCELKDGWGPHKNSPDNIVAITARAKDHVLAIQMRCLASANEELTAVGVWPGISHRKAAFSRVLAGFAIEVLILKLVAIDWLPTCSVAGREVTSLAHEPWNHTVETGSLVAKTLLAGAQGTWATQNTRLSVQTSLSLKHKTHNTSHTSKH